MQVMKKTMMYLAVLATLCGSVDALAEETPAVEKKRGFFLSKLGRGFENVILSLVEIPLTMTKVSAETDAWTGIAAGAPAGAGAMFARLGTGVFEIATFPFPPYYNDIIPYHVGESPAAQEAIDTFGKWGP
jgi:putative exosortase-associated protein (TIGR04073 family)